MAVSASGNTCGVTFTIGADAFSPIVQLIVDAVCNTSIPIDDRTLAGNGLSDPSGVLILNSVALTSGRISNISVSHLDVSQPSAGQNTLAVSLTLSGTASYDNWTESGWKVVDAGGHTINVPFTNGYGAFSFTIVDLVLTFQLVVDIDPSDDPFSTVGSWRPQVQNCIQNTFDISNLAYPSGSIVGMSTQGSQCGSDTTDSEIRSEITSSNFSNSIVSCANDRMQTFPNSGLLTKDITFCFGDVGINWPAQGGMQAAITGRIVYKIDKYTETPPSGLDYPPIPSSSYSAFRVAPYEIDAILWAIDRSGALNKSYDAQSTGDEQTYFTNSYKDILPELYKYAPDCQFKMTINTGAYDPDNPAITAPTTAIETVYMLDGIYPNDIPSNVQAQLQSLVNNVFLSSDDFVSALKTALTPDAFKSYSTELSKLAQRGAILCYAGVSIALTATIAGSAQTLVSVTVKLILVVDDLQAVAVTNPQSGMASNQLNFVFVLVQYALGSVSTAWSGGFTTPFFDWWTNLLGLHIEDFVKGLQVPGGEGVCAVPLPCFPGVILESAKIDLQDGTMTVTGLMSTIN
jgi:hypothetical protein